MSDFQGHLARVMARIREVTADQLQQLQPQPLIIDVREADEIATGHLPGAQLVGRGHLEARIARLAPRADAPMVLYCASGVRSALAAAALADMGFEQVRSLQGGIAAWRAQGLPIEVPQSLTAAQRARYARHLLLPEVGEAGQLKLRAAKVLLIGAGGLGSPAALYLAAAGVGHLTIVDADIVEASNLQRQILHSEDRLGMPKVESALRTLRGLNPEVHVEALQQRFDRSNALALVAACDVVVDGCDNFATRYLVNDACFFLKKPNVYASIFRFDGQASVLRPGVDGPCYRCLYPEAPPAAIAPNCAEAGVIGVLPGLLGTLQALEALKLILGIGAPLVGRLAVVEALDARFRTLRTRRDPGCALCGDQPTITELQDGEASCRR